MADDEISRFVASFRSQMPLYQSIKVEVDKFSERLKEREIRHLWQSRVKTPKSLESKLRKRQAEGRGVDTTKIIDLVAGRIVLWKNGDFETVTTLLREDFALEQAPIQHPTSEEHIVRLGQRFRGYDGLHLRLRLKGKRELDIVIEIQVVHIIMWIFHDVEHDLGYKGNTNSKELHRILELLKGTANLNALAFEQFEEVIEDQRKEDGINGLAGPPSYDNNPIDPPFLSKHNPSFEKALSANRIYLDLEKQNLLVKILQEIVANAAGAKHIQMFPFAQNEGFIIRQEIFELERKLPLSSQHQSAALWGLGGSGKTQIALEFAYRRYEQSSCSVFWVHADSFTSFLQDYKAIANFAGLSNELDNEELMSAVRTWLESQINWLLVIDNADALEYFGKGQVSQNNEQMGNLYSFVPRGCNGTILWTSRDKKIATDFVELQQGINVTSMQTAEAEALLGCLSNRDITTEDRVAVADLLERLDRLPLAISQAAVYMRRTSTSVRQYVEKLKKEKKRWNLLEKGPIDRHRRLDVSNSVMETWQISVDHVHQENPLAYNILHTIAYFNNQDIQFTLIKAAARSTYNAELESAEDENSESVNSENENSENENSENENSENENSESENDDEEVLEAATRLEEFSFLRLRQERNSTRSYDMHKLVQEATRYAINRGKTNNNTYYFSKRALHTMLHVFPESAQQNWKACDTFLPHALVVSNWPEVLHEKTFLADLLSKVWVYLHDQGQSRENEPVALKVMKLRREVLGERHPDTIKSMADLAATYHQQGRSKEDEEISVKVLELRREVLGERHPDTIKSMADLAAIYHQQGRWKEAEEINSLIVNLRSLEM